MFKSKEIIHFLDSYKNFLIRHKKTITAYLILSAIIVPFSWQQDIYDWYYFMGKFILEGKNVYSPINTYAIIKRGDTGRWGYPPLFLPIFSFSYLISAFVGVPFHVCLKIIVVFISLIVAKKIEEFAGNPSAVELFLFNPLIFTSVVIQGFLDVLIIYFILLALENIEKRSSAVYLAFSFLSKQTAWPLMPFFLAIKCDVSWFLIFTAVVIAGLAPFLFISFNDTIYSVALQHQTRVGIAPFSYLLSLFNIKFSGILLYAHYTVIAIQATLTVILSIYIGKKLRRETHDKIKILKYFLLFEVISMSYLYLLVPPIPHFVTYLIVPIIILMFTYPQFKYLYAVLSVITYISYTLDQGLRHNIFHYRVWEHLIYLGYWQLAGIIWPTFSLLSIVMYLIFFYVFRRGTKRE